MKKITAIFFVLLANIIIVAHAVVPHHHLPNQVFIISEHNDEDINGHNHHTNEHNHEHGDTNDYDYCLLKQVITIPTNTLKLGLSSIPSIDFNFGYMLAIFIKNDFACNPPPLLSFRQSPFHNSFYTCFINSVSGLRAPPSV